MPGIGETTSQKAGGIRGLPIPSPGSPRNSHPLPQAPERPFSDSRKENHLLKVKQLRWKSWYSPSDDAPFAEGFVFENSLRAEGGKIQSRFEPQDQLGDEAAHGRSLLEAVT